MLGTQRRVRQVQWPYDLAYKIAQMYGFPDMQIIRRLPARKSHVLLLETPHQQKCVLIRLGSLQCLYCLAEQHSLERWLAEHGFPIPYPLLNREGNSFTILDGAIFVMYPFVSGEPLQYENREHVTSTATTLARYHLLVNDYPISRLHRSQEFCPISRLHRSQEFSQELTDKFNSMNHQTSLSSFSQLLLDSGILDNNDIQYLAMRIPALVQIISESNYTTTTLPRVLVHGDISPSNLILCDGQLVALLDIERRHYDARIIDIGIALARLTCAHDQLSFKPDLMQAFVSAYNELSPIQEREYEILPLIVEAKIAMSVIGKIMNLAKASPEKREKRTLKLARKAKLLSWLGVNSKAWQDRLRCP